MFVIHRSITHAAYPMTDNLIATGDDDGTLKVCRLDRFGKEGHTDQVWLEKEGHTDLVWLEKESHTDLLWLEKEGHTDLVWLEKEGHTDLV